MAEQDWIDGERAAYTSLLRDLLRKMGYDDPLAGQARWILEREDVVAKLRRICGEHGDNDWEPDLHLGDVLEKHLANYLAEYELEQRGDL